jgi:uncharacterized protein YjbI with pentapeptide repeats
LLAQARLESRPDSRPTDLGGKAILNGADLRNARLCDVSFRTAKLRNADLSGTIAYKADFEGADVTQTSFIGARLAGANFEGVHFDRAALKPNLTCADLGGRTVEASEFCESAGHGPIELAAANLPDDRLRGFTLCRTLVGGRERNHDCGPDPVRCARDSPQSAP